MPNEDLTLEERDLYYGGEIGDFTDPHENTPCRSLVAGQYTDDTQLILAVTESLIESNGFNPESLRQKLIEWYDTKDDGRYRGEATKQGILNMKNGVPWYMAGVDKAGCGSATRAIPFGLYYYFDINKAVEYARMASCMTHRHALAKDGAACIAATIVNLVNGNIPKINELQDIVTTNEFKMKLDDVQRCLRKQANPEEAIQVLGNSSIVHETVCLSLFHFLSRVSDFALAVKNAANSVASRKKGDTDSIGCLAGGMSGAYNSLEAIPAKWARKVEDTARLKRAARQLYRAADIGKVPPL